MLSNTTRPDPVPLVVQVVFVDDGGGDGGAIHHRYGARPSIRRRRYGLSGRPGRRTLSTHAVAGAAITTTPGPHRGDRRDRQLRQDGGNDDFFVLSKPFLHTRAFQTRPRLSSLSRFASFVPGLSNARVSLHANSTTRIIVNYYGHWLRTSRGS